LFQTNFGSKMDKPKPNIGLKMQFKNLIQQLGLSIFDPKLGWINPAIFRVCAG